jgi:hypothetical protein
VKSKGRNWLEWVAASMGRIAIVLKKEPNPFVI